MKETFPIQGEQPSHVTCSVPVGGTEALQKDVHEMMGMMKNLSLNMMGTGRGQGYGYGHGGYESVDASTGGRGRGMYGRGFTPQCYNCGEWGLGDQVVERGSIFLHNLLQLDVGTCSSRTRDTIVGTVRTVRKYLVGELCTSCSRRYQVSPGNSTSCDRC